MARRYVSLLACLLTLMMTGSIDAQSSDTIRYTLQFPAPHTHYVEVEAVYPTGGQPQIELFMAVWTPGSYLVREYERHVENVTVTGADKRPHPVEKTRKNRWSVTTGGAATVTVNYRVYGREMTVRNNWIESSFAMVNGAPTFLTLADGRKHAHEVRIVTPVTWKGIATPLEPVAASRTGGRSRRGTRRASCRSR